MARGHDHSSVGWKFGDFDVFEEIGRGGMGAVFKATQTSLDRTVALKMINADQAHNPEDVARFKREAQTAAKVQHPNIVQIYDAGQICGQSYFAMEYVQGLDLEQTTKDGPLPAEQAARYVAKVARAVQRLHAQGILHRDLKPSNILIDGLDEPKVTDFGIAHVLGTSRGATTTDTVVGSPTYMAPEQASREGGPLGPWTDVHGLGGVLYRLLTGRAPFEAETVMDAVLQATRSAPERPSRINPGVPRAVEAICLRCLEKNPKRRYPTIGLVAADLDRFLAGEVVEAADPGVGTRLRRWFLRETNLAVHLLALGIVFAGELLSGLLGGPPIDLLVAGVLLGWIISCLLLHRTRWKLGSATALGIAWGAVDVGFLSTALLLAHGISNPAVAGYSVVIIGSGLWLRVRPVVATTLLALGAILLLTLDSFLWHPARRIPPDDYVITAVTVVAAGLLMVRHVRRTRALSRYSGTV